MSEEIRLSSDARKEQIKLRATFLNNIGIGVILVGVFTPVTRVTLELPAANLDIPWIAFWMVICFAIGLTLHLLATQLLKGLDR
ncbi:hypothetical protein [Neorhizobium galegae]|uniref:hypothetical protein n=1 Tax=Neorhizobium galegae TaxID=399 RepID=UPI0006224D0F|nr:hypothetical protein [Neorhizobium galegae]CDZ65270.1 Hypothetical protein NGAL_HAMBI2605_35390 [Neorhizobium galegae bv. orientalis]MCQ1569711.1 hypothetical protein [Neorhizobium galegae]MCQ1833932.1 hypothetical protein [Neorhizobium galegae]UIK06517.1 hypothetical protein LZK81_05930 [Neorhizobium galegae]UIY30331.1 hypothetical protein LZK73_06835 [Neorhizobium galegae]